MPHSPNYPDILGLITGGSRCNIGVAQCALAVRPRIVRAGRPFEVILFVQNSADCPIDLSMSVQLPPTDAKKQRDRFITKTQRLVVNIKAGGVGYVVLPVTSLPDTAVSDAYKIGAEIEVKALGKANRIRSSEGGGEVNLDCLSDEANAAVDALKLLTFSTSKHLGRNVIDVPMTVMGSTLGKMTDFTPGWVSVCKVSDYRDERFVLHLYGPTVQVNTLPKLKRTLLLQPLLETTKTRFGEAGYALKDAEATAIAKLLTLVLEYATPRFNAHGNIAARNFDVEALIAHDPFALESKPVFPRWFRGMMRLIDIDERAAAHPVQVITHSLYEDLLRDGVDFGFELAASATGEDFGSQEERDTYGEQLIQALQAKAGIDFNRVYLPLVMGGILINDQLGLPKENPAELLRGVGTALEERLEETGEAERAVYVMTNQIIARVGQRYGFYAS